MRAASPLCVPLLSALVIGLTSCTPDPAGVATPTDLSAGWELDWADAFEVDGRPNPANWTYETGFVRNEELQWYQSDNATCANGLLVITARRERVDGLRQSSDAPGWAKRRTHAEYTSASLTTRGLRQWQYGRFEMRARIDTRPGLWPVFWTLGVAGDWPHGGEIDVMEYYQGTMLANVFRGSKEKWVPVSSLNRFPLDRFGDPAWASKFHVWWMDWDEQRIQFFLDEQPLCQVDLEQTHNQDDGRRNPLREPHYLLLSLAVGGASGGAPSRTEFPAKFEVDYVRVFKPKGGPRAQKRTRLNQT